MYQSDFIYKSTWRPFKIRLYSIILFWKYKKLIVNGELIGLRVYSFK